MECSYCGSTNTTFDKKRKIFYWRKMNNKTSCHKCYNKRRVTFLGKRIRANDKELTGICQICNRSVTKGEIKQTQFHHIEYNESDPLKDTIEICVKCHYNQHRETRIRDNITGRFVTNK